MMIASEWSYFLFFCALWGFPHWVLFKAKHIYTFEMETALKAFIVGFTQFFLLALGMFYASIPVNKMTWIFVYGVHIVLTYVTGLLIRHNQTENNVVRNFENHKIYRIYMLVIAGVLLFFVLEAVRRTIILGDSGFYWFAKGWTFFNLGKMDGIAFLHRPSYPLFIPLVYNFFLTFESGVGVAAYIPILITCFIFLLQIEIWKRLGLFSPLIGLPLTFILPLFFMGKLEYLSYADWPIATYYAFSLLSVMDVLFQKRTSIPASLLLTAMPMIKANGQYLLMTIFISSFILIITNSDSTRWIEKTKLMFKLFSLPIIVMGSYLMIQKLHHYDTLNSLFKLALRNEVLNTPNILKAYLLKFIPSIKFYFAVIDTNPHMWFYYSTSVSIILWNCIDKSTRFIALNMLLSTWVLVGVIYTLIPVSKQHSWFVTGFDRMIAHLAPSSLLLLAFLASQYNSAQIMVNPEKKPAQ